MTHEVRDRVGIVAAEAAALAFDDATLTPEIVLGWHRRIFEATFPADAGPVLYLRHRPAGLDLCSLDDVVVAMVQQHDCAVFPMPRNPVLLVDVGLEDLGVLGALDGMGVEAGVARIVTQAFDGLQDARPRRPVPRRALPLAGRRPTRRPG